MDPCYDELNISCLLICSVIPDLRRSILIYEYVGIFEEYV